MTDRPPLSRSMKRLRIVSWLSLGVVTAVAAANGQLVTIGKSNPHACEEVKVQPNLTLSVATQLGGRLVDASLASMAETRIELRLCTSELKQTMLRRTQTDTDGRFSFGMTGAGRYRLVVFALGFKQPADLRCSEGKNCDLSVRLDVSPTDTFPESVCPPR